MGTAKPEWLKKRLPIGESVCRIEKDLVSNRLHTICQEAICPNQGECFARGVATYLIMGNVCTRNCRFCAVSSGHPEPLDDKEPDRLADDVKRSGLKYVVITSVTRDDLPDGGAAHFSRVIRSIRKISPGVGIEVLIPDFKGSLPALQTVIDAKPEVLNHNIETVPRLYPEVRPQAEYKRSIRVLENAKEHSGGIVTKTGIMVGLGEVKEEVLQVMNDLRAVECDILTIGQYLCPSASHYPVNEYIPPPMFDYYKNIAINKGFKDVVSGTFVRSSFMAEDSYRKCNRQSQLVIPSN